MVTNVNEEKERKGGTAVPCLAVLFILMQTRGVNTNTFVIEIEGKTAQLDTMKTLISLWR
ncbi:hypothetical protein SAMN04488054_102127 [Salibacterium qingdaonense]|uniref:Uncharacterized protein n=1 Tax=Salibacterium qingdaonense TaxID=266892 RepID=A0A1I4IMI4_9BACI|nr:hypothetical protein SAMN04488054_102127 [Salibacterium qingdaonense]